jgi:hypothetical protein
MSQHRTGRGSRTSARTVTTVALPSDCFGILQPPVSPWSYPPSRLVRVQLAAGATDWAQSAIDALVNICGDADITIEGPDPRLAAGLCVALVRQLDQRRGVVAS